MPTRGRRRACGAARGASTSFMASPASTTSIGPTGLPIGFEHYDRVAFINRDRMQRYLERSSSRTRRRRSSDIRSSTGSRPGPSTARRSATSLQLRQRPRRRPSTRRPIPRRRRCTLPARRSSRRLHQQASTSSSSCTTARSIRILAIAPASTGERGCTRSSEPAARFATSRSPDVSPLLAARRLDGDRSQLGRIRVPRAGSAADRLRCTRT